MRYVNTDGRPWYKQFVSGVLMSVLIVVAMPFALVALLTLVGLGGIVVASALEAAKGFLAVFGLVLVLFLLVLAWAWAKEEL